jgi:hypothetical protein
MTMIGEAVASMSFNSLTGVSLQSKGKVDGALKVSVTLTAEPSQITIVVH